MYYFRNPGKTSLGGRTHSWKLPLQEEWVQFLAGELRSLMQHRTAKTFWGASQLSLVVKNVPASAGDVRDTGPVPGSRRSLEGGHGNPLQYSYLENPMDSGIWWATVHRFAKN